eukprot:167944_1
MVAYDTTMVKVKAYLETKSVKAVKATIDKYALVLHYGIEDGEPLLPRHLVALFFIRISRTYAPIFLATFRATKQFEQLSTIKARNSQLYGLSTIKAVIDYQKV